MLVERFTVTSKQLDGIYSQLKKIKRLLDQEGGSPIQPEALASALKDIIEGRLNREKKENTILRLLSKEQSIIIDACDGTKVLADAKEIFAWGIEAKIKELTTGKPDIDTMETTVQVYEMVQTATFAQMFGFLGSDLGKLCLTQHQIINFCEKHPQLLRPNGFATFFMFKDGEQFFIACVYKRSRSLLVHVDPFGHGGVWGAQYSLRVVVPQLTT